MTTWTRHTHIPRTWLNLNITAKTVRALCGAQTRVFGIPGVDSSLGIVEEDDKRWFAWCPQCVDIFVPAADALSNQEKTSALVKRLVSISVSVVFNQYVAQRQTQEFPAKHKFRAL